MKETPSIPLLQEKAPAFTAITTKGTIRFPQDFAGKWVVLFSHPADFTPVCTSEFLTFSRLYQDFQKLNTALLGLSVDSVSSHFAWIDSMKSINWNSIHDMEIPFPIIEDINMNVASLYGMMQPSASSTRAVRAVFIIDPTGIIRTILYYPHTTGRNIDEILRIIAALQIADKEKAATPANWLPGDDLIMPLPKTIDEVNERLLNADGNYTCHNWYFCFKKSDMAKPNASDTNIFNPRHVPNVKYENNTIPVQINIADELEPLRNPHINIYEIAILEGVEPTPTPKQSPKNLQPSKTMIPHQMNLETTKINTSHTSMSSHTNNTTLSMQTSAPFTYEKPPQPSQLTTSSGRPINSCQLPMPNGFYSNQPSSSKTAAFEPLSASMAFPSFESSFEPLPASMSFPSFESSLYQANPANDPARPIKPHQINQTTSDMPKNPAMQQPATEAINRIGIQL